MRITLISTLVFAGILFIVNQVFAGPDSNPSPVKKAEDQKTSKVRGVTLSGYIMPAPKGPPTHRFAQDSVLVRFKPGTPSDNKEMGRQMIRGKKIHAYSLVPGLEHLRIGMSGLEVEDAVRTLERLPFVEYAQPNYIISINQTIPNDAQFSEQWALHNTGDSSDWGEWGPGTIDADIDAPEAWDIITDSNALVAIIDTGIYYEHPDLENNVWTNPGEIANNGVDDDGNGYVDDIHGWDFAYDDNNPFDGHGHGTHVAGIVAAEGNNGVSVPDIGAGACGVLWHGRLMALKALDDNGYGLLSDAMDALEYAVTMGAKISNNSWGYYDVNEDGHLALYDTIAAVQADNHLFIAAAGNGDGMGGDGWNTDITPHYPSSFDLDNIISVAATDCNDNLAWFSNYGLLSVDLAAPGVGIFSTLYSSYTEIFGIPDYGWLSGTSMATPHVTAVTAMVTEQHPDWTYAQIRDRIFDTVRPLDVLIGITVTGGIVNAANAVAVAGDPPTADFIYNQDNLTVDFTDQSTDTDGNVVSWDWDFGDGNTSTAQNPSHTYSDQGTYNVTLAVTDNDGASDETSKYVSVAGPTNVPPVASFTYSCSGWECSFDGSGSIDNDGTIESYYWDFGDGYYSSLISPVHSYPYAGMYSVTLTVTDDGGATNTTGQDVTLNNLTQINAPTNLTAVANSSRVTLFWNDTSGNEEGFAIERAQKIRGKYNYDNPIYETGPDVTSYLDTGVAPGTYKYRVRAFAEGTFSDYTNEALVKVEAVASICGDGYCDPNEECNCPLDCGTPPSTETICRDGLDNDCDGSVDCDDIDCENDSFCISGCLPKGSMCTSNTDCCSGECRGIKCK